MGVSLVVTYYTQSNRVKKIIVNSVETEGVIFDFEKNQFNSSSDDNSKYPVIRFVTKENKWITGQSLINISSIFFREGQKVIVTYNSENPTEFILKTKISWNTLLNLFLIVGIGLTVYGIYLAYNYLKQ